MLKNFSPTQILLLAMATVVLILAAFSFYLLQDPTAPLPFFPPPATSSSTQIPPALTIITTPSAPSPTRQTSYTPRAAFTTPGSSTPSETALASETVLPGTTSPASSPTYTATAGTPASPTSTATIGTPGTPTSTSTSTPTPSPTSSSATVSPSATTTLSPGEYGVTGRMLQNGTPVANVVVNFADDVAPRQDTTNSGGHYWFITLAPGTNFTLTFKQAENPNLTPSSEVTSLAWLEGNLPSNVDIINFPDFEVSLNINALLFELISPVDGAAYPSSTNSLQFNWSLYALGGTYKVQLGPYGSDTPVWSSTQLAGTSYTWNGTLDDGTHITQGNYWWRVCVTKSLGNYVQVICTRAFDIQFNP